MKEVRAQNAHRDLRPVCFRHRCVRVRHHYHYHRAGQNARRDLRPAVRRVNDSQIVRDRNHARRSMDEKPPAKMFPAPTTRAPPKWIHQEAVQSQHQVQRSHQSPRPHPDVALPHPTVR